MLELFEDEKRFTDSNGYTIFAISELFERLKRLLGGLYIVGDLNASVNDGSL